MRNHLLSIILDLTPFERGQKIGQALALPLILAVVLIIYYRRKKKKKAQDDILDK